MAADDLDRLSAMQASIDRRRSHSEERFHQIVSGRVEAPRLNFVEEPLSALHHAMEHAPRGPILVSFHTTAYFLLFALLAGTSARCAAIVNESIARKMEGLPTETLANVDFPTALSPDVLRATLHGRQTLFIMADVFLPYGSNAPLPFRDRVLRYTISWAELACRFDLPVILCLLKDRGHEADVHLQTLPAAPASPYHLAYEVFRRFDRCLGAEDDLWENFPAIDAFGRRIPPPGSSELLAQIGRLSLCDATLASSIRSCLESELQC